MGAHGTALGMALGANIGTFRGRTRVEQLAREDWASVTFKGARYRLGITLEGAGAVAFAADLLERLSELDLPIPGCIVADIALVAEGRRDDGAYAYLEVEALTIEEN